MNTKLDNITTQYRKFNANQVLTEGQLNEFIDYFDDQDRLSRTRLSGVGIACGFKSEFAPEFTETFMVPQAIGGPQEFDVIRIMQGAGVTTDGDLITLRDKSPWSKEASIGLEFKNYKYYRVFSDSYGYPQFFNGSTQMPLLELFTQEEYEDLDGANDNNFFDVTSIAGIENKIIILYLETYSKDETPCDNADCDNDGAEQVAELKVLLANRSDIDAYIVNGASKDNIYNLHNSYEVLYDRLKDIEVKRVILNTDITTQTGVRAAFLDAIQNSDIIEDLTDGFEAIADTFNIGIDLGGQELINRLNQLLITTSDDYQYRYDLLKDLVDTYNEIRGLVLHLKSVCCPDITAFPKHLLLGPVGASLELGEYTPFRHDFYNSPITTDADENKERLLLLANRFVQKIKDFQPFQGSVKITPSNQNGRLGNKAIPFYYNVNEGLLKKWNFERTQSSREAYNLSYHTDELSTADFVQDPLLYNIDDFDFFRIEGHLGMPYKAALENINDLKSKYGLAFDVVPLVLQKIVKSTPTTPILEQSPIYLKNIRTSLSAISRDVSNKMFDTRATLKSIVSLDKQLKQLNELEFMPSLVSGITFVKQDLRKDDIVAELLSDFLGRNSGLEHLSGVPKGGTFYLIYESEDNDEVIADFATYSLCCSKKDPVFLVMPDTDLCQNDAKIPITIIPPDGDVKAYSGTTQIAGVTKIGGQNFFNPSLVSSQYFGKTITFTVNDDAVDTEIKVHALPSVSVSAGTIVYSENQETPSAKVTFNISGNLTGLFFEWDFGDNTNVPKAAAQAKVEHTYQLVEGVQDVFRPKLKVSNSNGCFTEYTMNPLTLKLEINRNTKIYIYFDSSGSMDSTLAPLVEMRDTLLKDRLLPLYGGDITAYNSNVKVLSRGTERTFDFLNLEGEVAPEGNVIVLVFQDEADSIYHSRTISNRTTSFETDIQALKNRIANNFGTGNANYYRGVVFQVVGDTVFETLMKAVDNVNDAAYPQTYNLHSEVQEGKVIFKYAVKDGGEPIEYLNLIVTALTNLGYTIPVVPQ